MDQFVTSSRPNVRQNKGYLASQAIDLTESQPVEFTTDSTGPEQPKKRRRGMAESKRRAIRRHKQDHPGLTHADLIQWFQREHHHKIN